MGIRVKKSEPKVRNVFKQSGNGCVSDQIPWISFRYMTTSKRYSSKFIDSLSEQDRNQTVYGLYKQLESISRNNWVYWMSHNKETGLETISYGQMNFSPGNNACITKDTKMYVFRFDTYRGSGMGRIIGFKLSPCSVFHIIGYDFDFSAYDHG